MEWPHRTLQTSEQRKANFSKVQIIIHLCVHSVSVQVDTRHRPRAHAKERESERELSFCVCGWSKVFNKITHTPRAHMIFRIDQKTYWWALFRTPYVLFYIFFLFFFMVMNELFVYTILWMCEWWLNSIRNICSSGLTLAHASPREYTTRLSAPSYMCWCVCVCVFRRHWNAYLTGARRHTNGLLK